MATIAAPQPPSGRRRRRRPGASLPVVHQLRQSVGLQRGMLVAGLVLTGVFVLAAIFAPLLAPYGYAQLRDAGGPFGAQQPPGAEHLLGTTVGGYDVLSRVIWGAQTALLVIVVAVVLSIFVGVAARPGVGLLRRLARPGARRRLRRDLRVPVAAAGHRRWRS